MTFKDCTLSVVVVTKNEEKRIAKCIESIIDAIKNANINSSEIILVDSASTDKTVEIAMKYPIKIIQLHPSWFLSPAAGFYIGFLNSNGTYIQFQCGDSILDRNWFKLAIPILEKNENIAGVTGIILSLIHI